MNEVDGTDSSALRQELGRLAQQRWPIEAVTVDSYASLYAHHEKLIDALQFMMWCNTWTEYVIRCYVCNDVLTSIPKLKDGQPVCAACIKDIWLNRPGD